MALIDYGSESRDVDTSDIERQLQEAAQQAGVSYDKSDYEGVLRNISYDRGGQSIEDAIQNARENYAERATNTPGVDRSGEGHTGTDWYGQNVSRPAMPTQTLSGPNYPSLSYSSQFGDPATKQYEALLQAQLGLYQGQQQEMQRAAEEAKSRRAQTQQAADRLTGYLNERVAKLQGPAYTGSEGEVLRSQVLDPLELDRAAAIKRAYEQISARGITPDSGIAQELLNQVNRAFDEERTRTQGGIAQAQIKEQRSREQEAQQLLQLLVQLPDAAARGDLDFVNYVQGLIAQPGNQQLTVAQLLADLPRERLNDALATLGIAPNMSGANANLLQLLSQQQNARYLQNAQNANIWSQIGFGFRP